MAWGQSGGDNHGPWGKPPSNRPTPPPFGGGNNNGGGKKPPQGPDWNKLFQDGQNRFRKFVPPEEGSKKGWWLLLGALVLLWLASGIYIVRPEEQGVVLRFGKFHHTDTPGINLHWPYPVERALTPRVTAINKIEIGNRNVAVRRGNVAPDADTLMLTGDENIIDISFEVQWRISEAAKYLFNIRNQEEAISDVAASAMREVVGKMPIMTIISEESGKQRVQADTRALMQKTLDSYNAGIEVVAVNLLEADPPPQVIDAFRDVQSAKADRETTRNQAEAYRNDIVPRARGEAEKIVLDAEGYKQQVVAQADGEAARFSSIYNEYRQAKDVTRKRMYLETMENVLRGMNKVIVDGKSSGVLPYLPLPALQNKPEEAKP